MALLRIHVKDRDPIDVQCSKYEVKEVVEAGYKDPYLVLTGEGDREIGKYRMSHVVGYHWRE